MKTDRLVSIIFVLLDKKRIDAQALAEMFEVSPRTIYRDIDAINMSGIPVRSTPGVGGGFEIMPQYKLDKNIFSTANLSAILAGLTNLSDIIRGDELPNTLAKIKSFIPAEKAKDIEMKVTQICIDLTPWMGNRNIQPYLKIIQNALQLCRQLSFEYIDDHSNHTVRTVEPCQLVLKGNHWYLYGYCHIRRDFRLFRLSRMKDLQMEDATFTPGNFEKPILDFTDILEPMQKKIQLRIHKSILERILDYCTYDDLVPDGEAHYIVTFPFIENDYHYDILLSFGNNCECLEPLQIRTEMKKRIQEIALLYEK